jgi:two-component system, NarL family, sensor kinase
VANSFVRIRNTDVRRRPCGPFLQFAVVGLVGMLVVAIAGVVAAGRAGEAEAMADARARTEVIATTVVGPYLTEGVLAGDPAALADFDAVVRELVLRGTTSRIKLWDASGRIIYSDEPRLIGETHELGEDKTAALWSGEVVSEVSTLDGPENRFETEDERLLEVYLPIVGPDGRPLLYESYFDSSEIDASSSRILGAFVPIVVGSVVVMELLHLGLAWGLDRRLQRANRDRERLLRRAVESSDLERRRIAADLHDGVVQDLAGTASALAAAADAAARESSAQAADLRAGATGTRRTLQSLRSLLVDLYPPNLDTHGLVVALDDLLAPARALGLETTLEVADLDDVAAPTIALVYRVVQESIRNTLRHADARYLTVRVLRRDGLVVADVRDDGRGFDPGDDARRGLRLLSELSADAGAFLQIESSPGGGTVIVLEVAA